MIYIMKGIIIVLIIAILAVGLLLYINKNFGIDFKGLIGEKKITTERKGQGDIEVIPVKSTTNRDLGQYLTDSKEITLYVFSEDKKLESTCRGDCAKKWPPFRYENQKISSSTDQLTGKLNVIKRSDGIYQYAYGIQPLYYYALDKTPGDTNGNGIDSKWNIVKVVK